MNNLTLTLLIAFGLLNSADGWTTWQIFRFGGYEENGFVGRVIKTLGLYWALVILKVGCVSLVWWHALSLDRAHPDLRLLGALVAIYILVVRHNWLELQKHKK